MCRPSCLGGAYSLATHSHIGYATGSHGRPLASGQTCHGTTQSGMPAPTGMYTIEMSGDEKMGERIRD